MDELIKELKIENVGKKQPQGYSLDMQDDIEYGKVYSRLEKSKLVAEDPDGSSLSLDNSNIQYVGDNIVVNLIADFKNDSYRLEIKGDNK